MDVDLVLLGFISHPAFVYFNSDCQVELNIKQLHLVENLKIIFIKNNQSFAFRPNNIHLTLNETQKLIRKKN